VIKLKCLPLQNWITTSEFGKRDYKENPWHNGIDGKAIIDTPVYAVADGIVKVAKDNPGGYGLYITLDHSKWGSLYAHLSKFNVAVGQSIKTGQIIGYSGNTGMSTGPHLHFELRFCEYKDFWDRAGDIFLRCVDPLPFIENLIEHENMTVEKAEEIIQTEAGLDNNTIQYLNFYKYGEPLLIKLANAIK
jgi:murein DD-endopeptidase MepM/ murein hydrolase activator NlpD